jgi:hypothetical protein
MAQLNPEAIKQSREALHDDQSPRAVTLHMAVLAFENGWYANFPPPNSDEAGGFIDWVKPPRFGALARAIDLTLGVSFDKKSERGELGLLESQNIQKDKWSQFESGFLTTFGADIESIEQTEELLYLDRVANLVGYLCNERYIDAQTQLFAGANTAISTNADALKIIPNLVEHYAPGFERSRWGEVAKRSSSMSYLLARGSVERMLAGRAVTLSKPFDPSKYSPIFNKDDDLEAFKFNRLETQVVPKGLKLRPWSEGLAEATTVGEIESRSKVLIGCPLTLLNGRFRQLWEWMAETADKSGVWDTEESSRTSFASTAEHVNL